MAVPNIHADALDAALAEVAEAAAVHICSSEPANFAAVAGVSLASYTLTPGDGNGDFTIGAGTGGSRTLTLEAQSGNNATGTGAANVLAFVDGSRLLFCCEANGQTVNNGSPVTIPQTVILELPQPETAS